MHNPLRGFQKKVVSKKEYGPLIYITVSELIFARIIFPEFCKKLCKHFSGTIIFAKIIRKLSIRVILKIKFCRYLFVEN